MLDSECFSNWPINLAATANFCRELAVATDPEVGLGITPIAAARFSNDTSYDELARIELNTSAQSLYPPWINIPH